ncbi:MAG TPA: hypothetical protein VFS40_05550 [Gemmatimonadales bacterium]|nr:hypothetical protein [Gemmatimonadales bacterium]
MLLRRMWFVVPAVALALAACGDDTIGPGELKQADIAGNWTVKSAVYKEINSSRKVDLIDDLHYTGTAIVNDAGGFSQTFTTPVGPTTRTGLMTVTTAGVTLTPDGQAPRPVQVSLKGNTLTIVEQNVEFDVNNDGTPDRTDYTQTWEKKQ